MANPTSTPTLNAFPAGNQPAPQPQTGIQPTPPEIRKLKLKLDGQEVEMPESEVISLAQQGKVSSQRFNEAAAMKKQAEEVIKFAKDNPKEFFKRTGMNARQWAEEYLMEELRVEQMSPEQRKAAENEQKLKQYESERKQQQEQKRQEDMAREQAKHHESYERLFVEALTQSGLPKTAYTIKRMAELQLVNLKKKLDLSPDQLAKLVREDYLNEQKSLLGGYDGDQLLEFLGPDLVKKLSKAQISKLKAKGVKSSSSSATSNTPRKKSEGMSWREYQMKNRGRL